MRTLNVRLAVILFVGTIVFAGTTYFLHEFQVKRNASAFLREANRTEKEKNLKLTIENLKWYTYLVPNNPDVGDVMQRMGFLIADSSPDPRTAMSAFGLFEPLLRKEPNRPVARRRLVKILMDLGRYSPGRYTDAKEHIRYLLEDNPDDSATLLEELGECQMYLKRETGMRWIPLPRASSWRRISWIPMPTPLRSCGRSWIASIWRTTRWRRC